MKRSLRFTLFTLFTLLICAIAALAGAGENNAAGTQALPPATSPAVNSPVQKPSEPVVAQSGMRLGHVDLVRIGTESETAKAGQAQLVDLEKKLRSQIEAKQKQLEKQKEAIEAKLKTLTTQQREAKAKEFQKKVEEFQKFGMSAKKELQAKQEEFSDKLFKAVEQASTELGKAKGLALVVIKRELLYLGNGVDTQDVTEDVIKKIDKK
jgi:outer membrane protein